MAPSRRTRASLRDRDIDLESPEVHKRLRAMARRPFLRLVRDLRLEAGSDWMGDPAVWIYVEVEDSAAEQADFYDKAFVVQKRLEDEILALDPETMPFARFRTTSELRQLADEEKRR